MQQVYLLLQPDWPQGQGLRSALLAPSRLPPLLQVSAGSSARMELALALVEAEDVRRGAARVLAGLSLPVPHASARTPLMSAGGAGSAAAAAAADPQGGGTSQGGLGSRRSIRKRASPVRPKVSKAVSITLPGLAPAPASGRRKKAPAAQQRGTATLAFVGVRWLKRDGRWRAEIKHDGTQQHLGSFAEDQEAARAFDAAARRLRPKGKAHGVQVGSNWQRLNFPTAREEAYAAQQGLPTLSTVGSAEQKSATAASAAAQGFRSAFVGVCWETRQGRWRASIQHDGTRHSLGAFDDEQEAARAFDDAARRLRPNCKAHGVLSGSKNKWQRLNFPTAKEQAFAKGEGMPPQTKRN